jgi:hypothetical protein
MATPRRRLLILALSLAACHSAGPALPDETTISEPEGSSVAASAATSNVALPGGAVVTQAQRRIDGALSGATAEHDMSARSRAVSEAEAGFFATIDPRPRALRLPDPDLVAERAVGQGWQGLLPYEPGISQGEVERLMAGQPLANVQNQMGGLDPWDVERGLHRVLGELLPVVPDPMDLERRGLSEERVLALGDFEEGLQIRVRRSGGSAGD